MNESKQQKNNHLMSHSKHFTYIELPQEGELPEKLNHYLELISNAYIKLICEPLKKVHINFFWYAKRFKDASYIYLSNHSEWQSCYFRNHYYAISEFEDPSRDYQSGIFLWSGLPSQEIYQILQNEFNIGQGITIVQNYQDCIEFFHFGANYNDGFIINSYLNNIEILKRFILYFKDKGWETIQAISKYRFVLPKRINPLPYRSTSGLNQDQLNEFNQLTFINRFYISNYQSDIYLTRREMECLKWYSAGKTAEEIGIILGASNRTIESHLMKVKSKLSYYKKGQLAMDFSEFI